MEHDLASAMRRATKLVGAGDPAAATKMIQSALGGQGHIPFSADEAHAAFTLPPLARGQTAAGLHETLAAWSAKLPKTNKTGHRTGPGAVGPVPPKGASFDAGTFACSAGSRDHRVYVPNLQANRAQGMILMLHGCTQNPGDFAHGTDMNRLAEDHGLIVVYPEQSRGANMQSCWNWFGPQDQGRDGGEPAILAGLVRQLRDAHDVPHDKVFVAGLSAGAAMAVILGRTHPDVFAGVGAHSGLPYKSAHDVPSAFAAMSGGPLGRAERTTVPVPTIVFHGTADSTVSATNGQRIADEAHLSGTALIEDGKSNGRSYTRTTVLSPCGRSVMEHWQVKGQGHAWSGGKPAGSYTDPTGPDASAEMVRFFLGTPVKGT